jgi:hypothetical protein
MTILSLNKQELSTDLKARSVFKSIDNDQTVKLLLNFDSSFEDESQYNHLLERSESVTLNTSIKKFGNNSAYFNGSSYLAYRDSDEFFFGIEDFTIELWFYPTNSGTDWQGLVGQRISSTNNHSWYVFYRPTNNSLSFEYTLNGSSNNTINFGPLVSLNTWHHLAVCRSGSILYCFVDGILYSNTISNLAIYNSSNPLRIGWAESANYFTGYIDNLVIYKNLCKYTSSITVPTSESTITENTRLLIHGNQAHKNINNRTIYSYGDSNINTSYYKFGDGSGYFDGSGDYLTIPYSEDFDFGTGDFTLEFCLKWSSASYQFLVGPNVSYGMHVALNYDNNANTIGIGRHSVGWDTIFNLYIPLGQWCYLVFQRRSGYIECYLDGYLIGRAANSINYNFQSDKILLMSHIVAGYYYNGYVDEIRISKSIARYQYSNFTPETSQYTTDQYTKLLLHAEESDNSTNFIDSSETSKLISLKNNATISTSQYRFGSTSLYLNGINDYAIIPAYDAFNFGTDDFTIDFWVYVLNTGSYFPIIEARQSASYSNYIFGLYYISGAFRVDFVVPTGRLTSTSSIQLNQWQHIAIIRTSGILKCFINGVIDITTYTYASAINTGRSSLYLGCNIDGNYFNGYIDELRISKNIARWTENFTPPTSEYQTDQYTKLLLHMTGYDSSIEFIDSSGTNKTIIKYGDTTYRSDVYKFNNSCGYFDGSGDYLTIPTSEDFAMGSLDFTIDGWVKSPGKSGTAYSRIIIFGPYFNHIDAFGIVFDDSNYNNKLVVYHNSTIRLVSTTTVTTDTWIHFAVCKYNGILTLYINGISEASITYGAICSSSSLTCTLGWSDNSADTYFIGCIDEIRVSKGIARWTENFTPPTEPYTTDQYTKLLLHFDSNRQYTTFIDSSDTPKIVIRYGDTRLDPYNYKFNTASGYFDGTGDYLKIGYTNDLQFGTDNFTIDCWIKLASLGRRHDIYAASDTDDFNYMVFTVSTLNKIQFWMSSNGTSWNMFSAVSGNKVLSANIWYHIALIRNSNIFSVYINGEFDFSVTSSDSIYPVNSGFSIGLVVLNNTYFFNGWIDEFRISNTARWTSNFIPPTEPYISDQYTKLLLHFNGEDCAPKLIDSSQAISLPTVLGNAVIKTNNYKFGSSAMYFDGSGDGLYYPHTPDYEFLTNDFTIDTWIYPNVMPTSDAWPTNWTLHFVIFLGGTPSSSDGFGLILGQTKLIFHSADTQIISGTHNISINNWYHVAVTRYNNCFYLFVNGSVIAQVQSNSSISYGSLICIGNNSSEGAWFNGYIDELRVSKGIARWTSNFTPPSSAHITDQYTKLLMHFPSTDKNQTGQVINISGSVGLSTTEYKFSTSSGYFYGGFLSISNNSNINIGTENATIEFWFKVSIQDAAPIGFNSNPGWQIQFENSSGYGLGIRMDCGDGTRWIGGSESLCWNYTSVQSQWNHVAFVFNRTANTLNIYGNGILACSYNISGWGSFNSSSTLYIGKRSDSWGILSGYLDELRISKGIARYTSNFTPQTEPFVTDQYTKLLLHFNNFIDSSQSMDRFADESNSLDLFQDSYDTSRLFTSYNIPQISTDIYKFNSAALYFNGTSYITSPNSDDFNFGTEDFTISFWMYSPIAWSAQTAQAGIIGQKYSDSTYGWVISRDANNPTKLNFRGALTNNFPTLSTPTQNTWEHWCVIRSSGALYWYKNGALDSIANTNANNLIDVSADLYIGSAQTWGQKANIYLDEITILKGIALNSFTVPTMPSLSNLSTSLQVYSENVIISNKRYSAKFIADTNSLNKYTYTKFSNNLDLSKYKYLYFKLYPTVTGSKIKFSLNNLNNHNNIISGGTATADIYYDSNYIPSYGCDRNTANRWSTNNSAFPHWWKYDFGLGITKIVKKIRILNYYDSNGQQVRDFYFQGSNNDTDYTTIYTGNAAPICLSSWFEFNFENSASYRYYKLVFLNSYRTIDNGVGFWEIEFYETNDNIIEYTPNITNISTWQDVVIPLYNYSWQQKYNIDKLLITILNASTNNTFYIDDIYACNDQDLTNLTHNYQFTAYKDILNKLSGSSSLKFIANQSTSINKKITRKLTTPIDLSSKSKIVFAIYSNRSGSKFKIKFISSKPTELITKTTTRTYHTFYANTTFNPGGSGQINATVYGAGGAGGGVGGWRYGARGGNGGKSIGTISVTDQTYYIAAGAEGICHGTNTLNGRSNMSSGDNNYAGQSGGYAGIFIGSASQANALLIAGGGGGGGSSRAGVLSTGGAGGGLIGQDGISIYDNKFQYAGRGASQVSAGTSATSDSANRTADQAALQGGCPRTSSYGGGGGGGYFGGSAGGYSKSHTMAGGGWGSGYYNPTYVTNQVLTTGDGSAGGEPLENGQPGIVIIDYLSSDFPERQATSLIEITPNIANANKWELFELDITNISTNYKNAIDQIQVEMLNDSEETIFYIDYIFSTATYYIDPTNGNNANTGLSWATAWKTITGGPTSARIKSGDLIKIAKSIDPVSIGPAQWNNLSKTVTLSNTPDGNLTSTSLISKNINNDGWYPVQSVTGLVLLINNHYANSGASGRGYFGSTELIETYRRETYKLASSSDCTIQLSGDFYMSNRGHIKFEGGYNQSTDLQDGETYFDAISGAGNGLDLSNRSYISLNKLNMVRANYGLTLSSSNYNIVNSNSLPANTMHSLYMNNSNYNILELLNLINNGNDGFRLSLNACIGNKLTTRNINNNLACGIALTYSYENNIYAINCANNGATNIYFVQLCNNNKLKILNNKNSLGYGIDFGPNVNDNDIFNSSFLGNSLGSIKTINANQNYFFNAEFNDAIKIGSFTQYCDHKVFSNSESGDITKNYVYTDRGNIYSQSIIRHSNSGMAWTLGINNVICSEQYPLELCIARVLCLRDTPVTISCYLMRSSDTVTGRLIIKKYQVPELEVDLYHDIESIGSWEQAQIVFQVSIDCVLEIHAQAFGGSSNSVYVDDFNCSQV